MQDLWFPSAEGKDSKVIGRFVDHEKSFTDKDGKKITKMVILLEHKFPGSSDISTSVVKDFNKAELIRRFPMAWERYEKQKADAIARPPEVPLATELGIKGTPIENVSFLGKDKIGYLKSQGFYTVEQIAALSDTECQNIGFGAKTWRKKAAEHLASPTNPT